MPQKICIAQRCDDAEHSELTLLHNGICTRGLSREVLNSENGDFYSFFKRALDMKCRVGVST